MRDEIVNYINNRVNELRDMAEKAEMNGDIILAKSAIAGAIELTEVEIMVNNIALREIRNKIKEMINAREELA